MVQNGFQQIPTKLITAACARLCTAGEGLNANRRHGWMRTRLDGRLPWNRRAGHPPRGVLGRRRPPLRRGPQEAGSAGALGRPCDAGGACVPRPPQGQDLPKHTRIASNVPCEFQARTPYHASSKPGHRMHAQPRSQQHSVTDVRLLATGLRFWGPGILPAPRLRVVALKLGGPFPSRTRRSIGVSRISIGLLNASPDPHHTPARWAGCHLGRQPVTCDALLVMRTGMGGRGCNII